MFSETMLKELETLKKWSLGQAYLETLRINKKRLFDYVRSIDCLRN